MNKKLSTWVFKVCRSFKIRTFLKKLELVQNYNGLVGCKCYALGFSATLLVYGSANRSANK